MVRDPRVGDDDEPDLETVLEALGDPDCRRIIRALEEPMTAPEVCEACDIPSSTAYRKLDLLTEADLLEEGTQLRADGHHASVYDVAFEEVVVALGDGRSLSASISRPPRSADERLVNIWEEVRKET
jgi:DNA-binding transcriptional ArsR family regulator